MFQYLGNRLMGWSWFRLDTHLQAWGQFSWYTLNHSWWHQWRRMTMFRVQGHSYCWSGFGRFCSLWRLVQWILRWHQWQLRRRLQWSSRPICFFWRWQDRFQPRRPRRGFLCIWVQFKTRLKVQQINRWKHQKQLWLIVIPCRWQQVRSIRKYRQQFCGLR